MGRLWINTDFYGSDLRLGITDSYKRIRNSCVWAEGSLEGIADSPIRAVDSPWRIAGILW
jgi:hypothetical protein